MSESRLQKRPRSAVKEIEEASSTPRVHLIGSGYLTKEQVKPVRPRSPSDNRAFLPAVIGSSPKLERSSKSSSSKSAPEVKKGHVPIKAAEALPTNFSPLPVVLPPNVRWQEDQVSTPVFQSKKPQSRRLEQWPPSVTVEDPFDTLVLAVPKTNSKLKIQVRRVRDRPDEEDNPSSPSPEDKKHAPTGLGLFVHAFRLPSRAEGILKLGDEIVSAFGINLIDESPKYFAKLLNSHPLGDFVELTVRRRDPVALLSPQRKSPLEQPTGTRETVPAEDATLAVRPNNQQSPPEIATAPPPPLPRSTSETLDENSEFRASSYEVDQHSNLAAVELDACAIGSMDATDREEATSPLLNFKKQLVRPGGARKPSELLAIEVEDSILSNEMEEPSVEKLKIESPQALRPGLLGRGLSAAEDAEQEKDTRRLFKSDSSLGVPSKIEGKQEASIVAPVRATDNHHTPPPFRQASSKPKTAHTAPVRRANTTDMKASKKKNDLSQSQPLLYPYLDTPSRSLMENRSSYLLESTPKAKSRRTGRYGSSGHFSGSSTAQGLTLLHNLSQPFTRAEALAEGQVVAIALRQIESSGVRIVDLAARKIQMWARLTIPRKKFLRRMANREFVRSILFRICDKVVVIGGRRLRRRLNLLQFAGAVKIQRLFRVWRREYLSNVLRIQRAWRRAIVRTKVRKLVTTVRACILIYRYIQKRIDRYKKLGRIKKMKLLCKIMKRYFDYMGFEQRRKHQNEFLLRYQHSGSLGNMLIQGRRKHIESSKRENAVLKVQTAYRAYIARLFVMDLKKTRRAMKAFRSAVWVFLLRLKTRRRMKEIQAATILQRRFRGMRERTNMYKRVVAGIKITQAWFKFRQYKKLKEYCRRIVRPLRITISKIDNLPSHTLFSGNMRVKVSVWWSPLLHLMSATDYGTIVNSKRPQFVFKTASKACVSSEADTASPKAEAPSSKVSFYKVASLRLAVEKSKSLMENEVYIGQSLHQSPDKHRVPFTVVKPASSQQNHQEGTNWDEISGGGDVFENVSKEVAALPLIPRRSSLRRSKEDVAPMASPTASSAVEITPGDSKDQMPTPSEPSPVGSDGGGAPPSFGVSPNISKRKVSFDSNMDVSVDKRTRVESNGNVVPFTNNHPLVVTEPSIVVPVITAPVVPEPERLQSTGGLKIEIPQSSGAASASFPLTSQEKPDKAVGIDKLKSNPELLRTLSRRVSRARIAAEYRDADDSATALAAAAAEGDHPKLSSTNKKFGFGTQSQSPTSNARGRKASTLGKIGDDLAGLLFGAEMRKNFTVTRSRSDSVSLMCCNFENEVVHIPGCHGNSVIKFEVMDGDRKFGMSLFHMSAHNGLMFWGGEFEQEIHLLKSRRGAQFDVPGLGDASNNGEPRAVLRVKVEGGVPRQSKCDWCRASFKGIGTGITIQGFGMLSSFFDKWKKYYVSIDGVSLRFCDLKNSIESQHSIPVSSIKSYRVELSGFDRMAAKQSKTAFVEDGYFFIITTSSKEEIFIKFADSSIRQAWEETLEYILEFREDSLKQRTSLDESKK